MKMQTRLWCLGFAVVALLSGCATAPDTITHKATGDPHRQPLKKTAAQNGAIFQSNTYNAIFENRRARNVGDNLVIAINEKTSATTQGAGAASGEGSVNVSPPMLFNKTFPKISASSDSKGEFSNKSNSSSSNNFTGTIAVTVIEILPNNNLLVSGEKQIAMDNGAEFIRFSGIVNPKDIQPGNVVSSTLVADARVEYRTNSRVDMADVMSKLARFFLTVLPF